jgi:hypothetical protein
MRMACSGLDGSGVCVMLCGYVSCVVVKFSTQPG